jgi:hypothetical protein
MPGQDEGAAVAYLFGSLVERTAYAFAPDLAAMTRAVCIAFDPGAVPQRYLSPERSASLPDGALLSMTGPRQRRFAPPVLVRTAAADAARLSGCVPRDAQTARSRIEHGLDLGVEPHAGFDARLPGGFATAVCARFACRLLLTQLHRSRRCPSR